MNTSNQSLLPTPNSSFGHGLRPLWTLDPTIHFLNHGSYGATPRYVQAAQARWQAAMEAEPVRFMSDELPGALFAARGRLAAFLGATPQRLAFVDNATAGANAVLRSLPWQAGDRIVIANHGYAALKHTAHYLAGRHNLTVAEADVPWPLANPQQIVDAYARAIEEGARLLIVDHIFSPLAVVTPVAEIAALCRARGVPLLIDGAHAPGLLPLELDALAGIMAAPVSAALPSHGAHIGRGGGAEPAPEGDTPFWYIGNCHKWLCAPKGVGFLYANPEGQRGLHPAVISNFYGQGYEQEFAWTGTQDPSARLSVPAALEFLEALGVERYRGFLKAQAWEAATLLADAWGVTPGAPQECFISMVTLPFPVDEPGTQESRERWRLKLLKEHRVEVPLHVVDGKLWVRISAQVYNEISDFEVLAKALAK